MRRGLNTSSRRQRGAAMTELAVMMLAIIPILVYGFFLMDAAYMKLDLQEVAVSGVWDFTTRNTQANGNSGHAAQRGNEIGRTADAVKIVYSDHTSAFDDGGDPQYGGYNDVQRLKSNTDHKRHHIGLGAQYSYHFSGGEDTQFTCTHNDQDLGWLYEPGMNSFGKSKFSAGGQATCKVTGYIYNYIIPKTFMQELAGNTKMTRLTARRTGPGEPQDVHSAAGDRGADAYIETRASAAVSFNTWALLNGSNNGKLDSNSADIGARSTFGFGGGPTLSQNPFYKAVKHVYTSQIPFIATYANVSASGMSLMQKAASENLMTVIAVPLVNPPVLPNVLGTYLTARYQPDTPGVRQKPPGLMGGMMHKGFLSTPYDGINNNYRDARNKRGVYYMGCRGAEGRNCN
ncbi:hypothetical protein P2318_06170 [Myxococcaceae bacterium GXIMD 01537]